MTVGDVKCLTTFQQLLSRGEDLYGDRVAFIDCDVDNSDHRVTYRDLNQEVSRIAERVRSSNKFRRRIALIGENSYEWVVAFFSIVCGNKTAVLLDKEGDERVQVKRAIDADIDAICCTFNARSIAERISMGIREDSGRVIEVIPVRSLSSIGIENSEQRESGCPCDEECAIVYSSGSTGTGKGVVLSQQNYLSDLYGISELVTYLPSDVFVSVLPLHHAYELMAGVLCPLFFGSSVVLCPNLRSFVAYIIRYRPTVLNLVPSLVSSLYSIALAKSNEELFLRRFFGKRLRMIVCGGAALDKRYCMMYKDQGIDIVQGYGATECSPVIAVNDIRDNRIGSVGKIISPLQVRFEEDGGIQVKGTPVALRYLDSRLALQHDGWFATGDVGYIDQGYLYIIARRDDVVVLSNGEKVVPYELEGRLQALRQVMSAAVIGERIDGREHPSLVAYLELNEDAARRSSIEVADLVRDEIRKINRDLHGSEGIAQFVFCETPMDRTATQKIIRSKLPGMKGLRFFV